MYRRHYLENWCWTSAPPPPHPSAAAAAADCLEFEPFEMFPHDAWARMEGEQLEAFRKHAVAAYRKGGEGGLQLRPPLAVAIDVAAGGAAATPVELANLRLDVSVGSSSLRPLFMPVFILEFPRFGQNFRVFVGRGGYFERIGVVCLSDRCIHAYLWARGIRGIQQQRQPMLLLLMQSHQQQHRHHHQISHTPPLTS